MSFKNSTRPPPWEVLVLVANHLDPKALAIASCVCKSWSISMSSNHVWQPICTTHYPSLSNLKLSYPLVPYHRLYAIGYTATKRRLKTPSEPRISLNNLIFAIDLHTKKHPIVTIAKPCNELGHDQKGVFRFDIDVNYERLSVIEVLEEVKVTWNVVLKGLGGVFTMMDSVGKLSFMPGARGWFSEELPSPGCCSSEIASGIVADFKLGLCNRRQSGGRRVRMDKVSVGMMSIVNWRYVSVDDGLRYLQHFLLPCHV